MKMGRSETPLDFFSRKNLFFFCQTVASEKKFDPVMSTRRRGSGRQNLPTSNGTFLFDLAGLENETWTRGLGLLICYLT